MNDVEDELRVIKRKLFPGATKVPRTYIELLHRGGAAAAERGFAVATDSENNRFSVYWLDGQLFRGLSWVGDEHTGTPTEVAYPLSTLTSVKTQYSLGFDSFTRLHTQWDRHATLQFGEGETIILEVVAEAWQETYASQLVDEVLAALAGR